ncbi:MaoC/PaaZ C-terminal domain-containing protein [Citricoccus nitrophenolicus]|uniref:MaoC/PaaZ C-terminal domain-containing protein n=1 Tax=Citricoccus nitrophenolicus TaxID=863575 RepID=A0ABV0IDE2_9MICC|nr:MaoC/PaaZ C-terminal domain-containing protein [Citricoccus sp. I39-566]WMY77355.1 MaoC/PaaZ C-terminal domain-containing protein [Citricoccus sp. I39-566]
MERESMTPLASSYRAALATAATDALLRRRRPPRLPGRTVVVQDHQIPADLVARYAELFHAGGPLDPRDVPSVLVHVAAFPAAMELMADREFPLPLLGMVHLENRVVHHAAVPSGAPLTVAASATALAPHPSGTTVDLVVTVHGPGGPERAPQLLWEGTSTYLATGVRLEGQERPPRAGHPPFVPPDLTARWSLPGSTGRGYAAVSGDYNPIHLNPLTARALGQKGMIAHGMYLAGRMLAGREPAGGGYSWQIGFATPVLLPGTVSLGFAHPAPGRTEVTAWDGRRQRPHFTGSITDSATGSTTADQPAGRTPQSSS